MISSGLFTSVLWMLLITQGLQSSAALTVPGPCEEELNRSQQAEGGFEPQCTPYGSYEDKQCNTTHCWCVDQCGEVLPGTYGDSTIRCEEQPAPCLQEYMSSHAIQPVFGVFRPRCRSDGFYYHTQCLGTNCFCYDRCGHTVSGSDHHIARVRQFLCACPNDDQAYNCPTDPCEGAVCDLYPDAICKASICGGCKAEFYVDGNTVQCVAKLESCTDSDGATYPINAEFERDCQICTCTTLGEISCLDMPCPPPTEDPPEGCQYLTPPGGCCPTRVFCMKPLSDCPPNTPVAMCGSNECLTATCEAYPDAICSIGFCGATACKAFFYDKDQNEVDCKGNDGGGNGIGVPTGCLDPEGLFHAAGSNWHSDACTNCFCTDAGYITCAQKYCAMPPPYCGVDPVQDPEACCPSFTCPDSCTDSSGNVRAINEEYVEECQTCTCTPYGETSCLPNPCPPQTEDPPARCQYVTPPGSCCPTRLACMESEFNCVGPVAMCLYNTCLDAICEAYPDAKCSISFCGLKACQAVFYDENDQELDCANTIIKGCVDETSGKSYKVGESYNDGCNDCTCMEDGGFVCTEKACGCVEESTGIFYKIGDSFNDGCNDCMCKEGGFACTEKFCKVEETEPLSMCDPWNVQIGFWSSRPRCRPDGSYSPKQCSEDGSCWCVDDLGDRIRGSLRLDGSSVQCEIDPPCQMEVTINQRKAGLGETLTSDPTCDKDGFYEVEQCDSNQCWCSETDGTVVLGSYKTNREDLKCSKVCFGKIPLLLSKCSYHNGCPEGYACHMERCCRIRITEP